MRKFATLAAVATVAATFAGAANGQTSKCFVEAGIAGTFLAVGERHAQGSVGGGCDLAINAHAFAGASLRADLGDTSAAVVSARLGAHVNPHLSLYGIAGWSVPEFKLDRKAGQLVLGGGVETAVGAVPDLSVFGEATVAAAKVGAATTEDLSIRAGIRRRF